MVICLKIRKTWIRRGRKKKILINVFKAEIPLVQVHFCQQLFLSFWVPRLFSSNRLRLNDMPQKPDSKNSTKQKNNTATTENTGNNWSCLPIRLTKPALCLALPSLRNFNMNLSHIFFQPFIKTNTFWIYFVLKERFEIKE